MMSSTSNLSVSIVGAGNLAWSLVPNLHKQDLHLVQLVSRSRKNLVSFATAYPGIPISQQIDKLDPNVDLICLCVPDDAIQEVVLQLPKSKACLIHCSGSTSIDALKKWKAAKGVWYPMQIFTKDAVVDLTEVPSFVEGKDKRLRAFADTISPGWRILDSDQRMRIHLGAVIACNFTNYMLRWSSKVAHKAKMDFSIYLPLIREHIQRALYSHPARTQTGPAVRGDMDVIHKHLNLLEHNKSLHQLYKDISRQINPELILEPQEESK